MHKVMFMCKYKCKAHNCIFIKNLQYEHCVQQKRVKDIHRYEVMRHAIQKKNSQGHKQHQRVPSGWRLPSIEGKHSDHTFHTQLASLRFKLQMHCRSREASCEAASHRPRSGCKRAESSPAGPLFSSSPLHEVGRRLCLGGLHHPSSAEPSGLRLLDTLAQSSGVQEPLPHEYVGWCAEIQSFKGSLLLLQPASRQQRN